jgi:hypothetical protein
MSDTQISGTIRFSYNSNLFIKGQAYAPINPLQCSKKFAKRSILHMNVAESAAPGYINAWACIQDLCIDGEAKICYREYNCDEKNEFIKDKIDLSPHKLTQAEIDIIEPPKGIIIITLSQFPIKSVKVSCSFDGSVLADMVQNMVNGKIEKVVEDLKEHNFTFQVQV